MKSMHAVDIELVEMTLDIMKYAVNRISNTNPELGSPQKEELLDKLVGTTITEELVAKKPFNYLKIY